ncbi:hypothetical protein NIES4101_68910 [Calothrix sp. NIES-4101]|nr:hypothetical protein NIES4101_68910 [Calothrix sp. NIES-4101]
MFGKRRQTLHVIYFDNLRYYEVFIRKVLHKAAFVVCLTQKDIKTEIYCYKNLDYQKAITHTNIKFYLHLFITI